MSVATTRRHPKEFGFSLGMEVTVDVQGHPTVSFVTDDARLKEPVVYVGILEDDTVLKVGISKHGLAERWKGILGVMNQDVWHRLRPNEKHDGERLIRLAAGKRLTVWLKRPIRVQIPYAADVTEADFCGRHAEEMFLDQYYQPAFGQRL